MFCRYYTWIIAETKTKEISGNLHLWHQPQYQMEIHDGTRDEVK